MVYFLCCDVYFSVLCSFSPSRLEVFLSFFRVWSNILVDFLFKVYRVVFLKPSLGEAFVVVSLEISLDSGAR